MNSKQHKVSEVASLLSRFNSDNNLAIFRQASMQALDALLNQSEQKIFHLISRPADEIKCIVMDDSTAYFADDEGTVWVFDCNNKVFLHVLREHHAAINQIALSNDKHWLVTVSDDTSARIYMLDRFEYFDLFQHHSALLSVAISANNQHIVLGSSCGLVMLKNRGNKHSKWEFDLQSPVQHTLIAADQQAIFAIGQAKDIYRLDIVSGTVDWKQHLSANVTAIFQASSNALWLGCDNGLIICINPNDGSIIKQIETTSECIHSICLSEENNNILISDRDGWKAIDALSGCLNFHHTGPSSVVDTVWVFKDDRHMLVPKKNKLLLIDTKTGHCKNELCDAKGSVNAISMDANEKHLLLGRANGKVDFYNFPEGQLLWTIDHGEYISDVCICGDYIVFCSYDGFAKLVDLQGNELNSFKHHYFGEILQVYRCKLIPEKNLLVTSCRGISQTVRLYNTKTGELLSMLDGHQDSVFGLDIAHTDEGIKIITGSADNTARIWDLETQTCEHTLYGHESYLKTVAISEDGRIAVTGSADRTVRIFDVATEKCRHIIRSHQFTVEHVHISGQRIATASNDCTAQLFDLYGRKLYHSKGSICGVTTAMYTHKGDIAVTGKDQSQLFSIMDKTGKIAYQFPLTRRIRDVSLSRDKKTVYFASGRFGNLAYNMETLQLIRHFDDQWRRKYSIDCVGNKLITAGTGSWLYLFHTDSNKLVKVYTDHEDAINKVVFNNDGSYAISASCDQTVKLWCMDNYISADKSFACVSKVYDCCFACKDTQIFAACEQGVYQFSCLSSSSSQAQQFFATPSPVNALALSQDETFLVLACDDGCCILNLETKQLTRLHNYHSGSVRCLTLDFHGTWVITAGNDGKVIKTCLKTGKKLNDFVSHHSGVRGLELSVDEQLLITTGKDCQVHFSNPDNATHLVTFQSLYDDSKFLWTSPPDAYAEHGWFYTNAPEMLNVLQTQENSRLPKAVTRQQRMDYLKKYTSKDMLYKRLNKFSEYEKEVLKLLQTKTEYAPISITPSPLRLSGRSGLHE